MVTPIVDCKPHFSVFAKATNFTVEGKMIEFYLH